MIELCPNEIPLTAEERRVHAQAVVDDRRTLRAKLARMDRCIDTIRRWDRGEDVALWQIANAGALAFMCALDVDRWTFYRSDIDDLSPKASVTKLPVQKSPAPAKRSSVKIRGAAEITRVAMVLAELLEARAAFEDSADEVGRDGWVPSDAVERFCTADVAARDLVDELRASGIIPTNVVTLAKAHRIRAKAKSKKRPPKKR